MKRFKRHRGYGFFEQDVRLSKLGQLGDPLEKVNKGVDFELFRICLGEELSKQAQGKGGRPAYGYVLMFKALALQRYYNLSGGQAGYQINDRTGFRRFLDLTIADDIPDSKTVWDFRGQLIVAGAVEGLFALFITELEKLGLVINQGKIVDASFIEVPKQRNSRDDNQQVKAGQTPESSKEAPARRLSQKDLDARRTKKNGISCFGYKNHVKADSKSKIITGYGATGASVHGSQPIENLPNEKGAGQELYADSAYTGEGQEKITEDRKMVNKTCEKGYRDKPLTDGQKESNRKKSSVRSRAGHVFGFMETSMDGMYLYNTGIKRVTAVVGLMNLTYNMSGKIQLKAF